MQMRLENALQHKLSHLTLRHQQLHNRLQQRSPINTLKLETNRLSYLNTRLMDAIQHKLTQSEQKLSNTAHQLDTVSPLATLSRGYSITKDNNGKVLFDGASVKSGDEIQTQLARGHIASVVK
jgi:exodeoxyribonuclease VII large subunit